MTYRQLRKDPIFGTLQGIVLDSLISAQTVAQGDARPRKRRKADPIMDATLTVAELLHRLTPPPPGGKRPTFKAIEPWIPLAERVVKAAS